MLGISLKTISCMALLAVLANAAKDQSALRRHLFANYDKFVKPGDTVKVNVGISATGLDYNPMRQVLTVNTFLQNSWTDSRLTWDKDDWGGVSMIRVPASEVWRPDITLFNSARKAEVEDLNYNGGINVIIYNTGNVIHVPLVIYRGKCPSKAGPKENAFFAEEECKLKFGSWTYDQSGIDVDAPEPMDFSFMEEPNVRILDSSVRKEEKTYPSDPDHIYPSLDFKVKFQVTAKMNQDGTVDHDNNV